MRFGTAFWERRLDDRIEIIFQKYDLPYNEHYEKKKATVILNCLREIQNNKALEVELARSKNSLEFFVMQTIMYNIKED